MKLRHVLLAALAASVPAGCSLLPSLSPPSHLVCPKVQLAPDLDRLAVLGANGEVLATARLGPVTSTCAEGTRSIVVKAELNLRASQNGSAAIPQLDYFFAVSDANRTVLNEAEFGWVPDTRAGGSDTHSDKMTITIPTYDPGSGGNFDVFVGFRLSPEQLQYNRQHPNG